MNKVYPLGEWNPDLPGNGLIVAENVYAVANGYAPVKGALAFAPSLVLPFRGGGAFIDSTGASSLIAARTDTIFKYTGSAWATIGVTSGTQQIRFAQFGDNLMLADGGPVQSVNLLTTLGNVLTSPPNAIDVAQARDFVMVITTDNALQWCQFDNSAVWTTGTNQADKQPSLWGQLRRIVGGEYILALTDRGVVRGTYVGVEGGLDIIWQFDQISAEVGCMASGSVCNVGRLVFFLSERGFEMCDGQAVTPIGSEKFNRWFFSNFSRADIANIWSAVDPRNNVVMWGMPGSPGLIVVYNWVLQRATTIRANFEGMFTGYTSGVSLDTLDATYGNLDAIPFSLDNPALLGGNPILILVDNTHSLATLSDTNMEATLTVENIEPTPGRRSRAREVRLDSDTLDASVTIDARMRAGDDEFIRSSATMRGNGKMPIRSNGRYNTVSVTVPAGEDWTYIKGIELEFEAGDGR